MANQYFCQENLVDSIESLLTHKACYVVTGRRKIVEEQHAVMVRVLV